MPYYAVRNGRSSGVVHTNWSDCEQNVKGYSGASFKKFDTLAEAQSFSSGGAAPASSSGYSGSSYCGYSSSSGGGYNSSSGDHRFHVANDSSSGRNVVYTDGSCINNGRSGASAGYGVYFPETSKGYCGPLDNGSNQTNQRAELHAIKHAVKQSHSDPRDLEIRTDSKYAVEGLTNWSKNWSKDWDAAPVANKKDFKEIIDLAQSQNKNVYLKHVPGHNGEPGNEEAHKLAQRGATGQW